MIQENHAVFIKSILLFTWESYFAENGFRLWRDSDTSAMGEYGEQHAAIVRSLFDHLRSDEQMLPPKITDFFIYVVENSLYTSDDKLLSMAAMMCWVQYHLYARNNLEFVVDTAINVIIKSSMDYGFFVSLLTASSIYRSNNLDVVDRKRIFAIKYLCMSKVL